MTISNKDIKEIWKPSNEYTTIQRFTSSLLASKLYGRFQVVTAVCRWKRSDFFLWTNRDFSFNSATEMLVAILNTCAQDDPEEIAEEVKKIQMDQTVPEDKVEDELDEVQRRREIIKNKIRAVGKVGNLSSHY